MPQPMKWLCNNEAGHYYISDVLIHFRMGNVCTQVKALLMYKCFVNMSQQMHCVTPTLAIDYKWEVQPFGISSLNS